MKEQGIFVLGAYAEGEFVGFLHYVATDPHFVYLAFFAFFPEHRGKGYGTASLQYLKSLFPDRPICIDRELIDPTAEDNDIRIRRRAFYMRAGFVDQSCYQLQNGIIYQTMSTPGFVFAPLRDLVHRLSHHGDPRYYAYYFETLEEAESFKKQWLLTIDKRFEEWKRSL